MKTKTKSIMITDMAAKEELYSLVSNIEFITIEAFMDFIMTKKDQRCRLVFEKLKRYHDDKLYKDQKAIFIRHNLFKFANELGI